MTTQPIPFLSDHRPFVVDTNLVWNILTQCRFSPNSINNSYRLTESPVMYELRLLEIVHALSCWVVQNNIERIFLQECPCGDFYDFFHDRLHEALKKETGCQWFSNYSGSYLPIVVFSKKPVKVIDEDYDLKFATYLCDHQRITQVHLNYLHMLDPVKSESIKQKIQSWLTDEYLVLGDFNFNLQDHQWSGFVGSVPGFYRSKNEWAVVDGFLSSQDMPLTLLPLDPLFSRSAK